MKGAAEQTVYKDLGALSVLVSYAMRKGWITTRPEIKRFAYQARIRWLDSGQLASYAASLRPAFRVQMQLLVVTGLRLGKSERRRRPPYARSSCRGCGGGHGRAYRGALAAGD